MIKRDGSINGNASYINQQEDGFMTMVVRSQLYGTGTAYQKITAKSDLIQSEDGNSIVFETEPEETNGEIYFEISKTFLIENGFHKGDTDQTSETSAVIELPFYNCYTWGNGFESIKIKDLFNSKKLTISTRPSTPVEDYRQNKRIASLTYSKPFEQSLNYNGINEFNQSDINFCLLYTSSEPTRPY